MRGSEQLTIHVIQEHLSRRWNVILLSLPSVVLEHIHVFTNVAVSMDFYSPLNFEYEWSKGVPSDQAKKREWPCLSPDHSNLSNIEAHRCNWLYGRSDLASRWTTNTSSRNQVSSAISLFEHWDQVEITIRWEDSTQVPPSLAEQWTHLVPSIPHWLW